MPDHDELAFLDATAQAELVRKGELTPGELLEAAIARAEKLNPTLNAIITPLYDLARQTAAGPLPDGPFKGAPFLLKDIMAAQAGVPQACGTAALKGHAPKRDATLTARYKAAGLVIFGRTNTPEFGLLPTTEPRLFGPTKNPWALERTPGGSSGGSAAAVAAGLAPMAHANDGGGSIRIPASCCGLFGLKPTRARNPKGPVVGDAMGGMLEEHALTRSVRDSALLLDCTSGPEPGDPYWAPPKERPYIQEAATEPGRLRIAFSAKTAAGGPVHPDCLAAMESAAKLCAELGHIVEEDAPNLRGQQDMGRLFTILWTAGLVGNIHAVAMVTGKKPDPADYEPLTWALYQRGLEVKAGDYLNVVAATQLWARQMAAFMARHDVWLTPTLAEPPLPLGSFDVVDNKPMDAWTRGAAFVPYTPLQNCTGQPAMSVPLYWNDQGLPIGCHFVGRFGDEATLFRLAGQLERARPWAGRRPPLA